MKDNKLMESRKEIDKINLEILKLIERRMEISAEVAKIKAKEKSPVLHQSREQEILEYVVDNLNNKSLENYVVELFTLIMNQSKDYQNKILEED